VAWATTCADVRGLRQLVHAWADERTGRFGEMVPQDTVTTSSVRRTRITAGRHAVYPVDVWRSAATICPPRNARSRARVGHGGLRPRADPQPWSR
jgi:hypothetical protein